MTVRIVAVLLAGAALLTGPASANGSKNAALRPSATFRTGKIALLAADGTRAAVAPAKRRPCGSIVVWDESRNRSSGFHLRTNGCAGDGVQAVALGGDQVAWIEHGGGNDLELNLFAAGLRGGRARQLEFQVNGDRAGGDPTGGWVGNLVGGGSVLAYNRWKVVCERPDPFSCGGGDPQLRVTDERLIRIASGRTATVLSGGPSDVLAAAGGGRLAVRQADRVVTYTAMGAPLASVADPDGTIRGVGLTASALVLFRGATLDLYDPASGRPLKSIALGSAAGARVLLSATKTYALLAGARNLVLVRLADGARATVALPLLAQRALVGVRLTDGGLFYAYNVRAATAPGRVAFVRARTLASAF
ncbi:MAG: hypothetical protein ACTHNB_01390 [Gaiellaceae bacterium]